MKVPLLFAVSLCALVAAAAAVNAGASPARVSLCLHIPSVRSAEVVRAGTPIMAHPVFSIPARIRVSLPVRAAGIARLVCTLPYFPSGIYHCPFDGTLRYQINFPGVATASVDPNGCETVTGAGPIRWAGASLTFWHSLGALLGYPHASLSTFQGHTR